jgi:serine/threonine protein kinase
MVLAQHTNAWSRTRVVDIGKDVLLELVVRGIEVISTEPTGLELALSVRSKFMSARHHCRNGSFQQAALNLDGRRLQDGIHEAVWDYLRRRLKTDVPAENPMIAEGIPDNLGNSTLGKLLGEGAWGKVFLLQKPDLEVDVIKALPKASYTSLNGLESLNKEISVMKRLSTQAYTHPNIIRLFNTLASNTHVFLQMEYGGSETLTTRLQKRDDRSLHCPLPLYPNTVSILIQCASALHHLHSVAHVAHRDLKTENIIYSDTGVGGSVIKIADFGLASICGSETTCYSRCGTFLFNAPEVILDDSYNACIADVWSMGIIFLEVLCFLHFPDNVLFRKLKEKTRIQAMEEVRARLGTPGTVQSMIQTYLRPEYRITGILRESVVCGMLNVVTTSRSKAQDVFSCCSALHTRVGKAIELRKARNKIESLEKEQPAFL